MLKLLRLLPLICLFHNAPAIADPDDAAKAKPDVTLTGHARAVVSLAFSSDGKHIASVDQDGVIKLWDPAAGKELASVEIEVSRIDQVEFTPDGKSVVALGAAGVAVMDVATGKAKPPIAVANMDGGPTAFDVSPDSTTIAVVGSGTLRFYDLASGAAKASYVVHEGHSIAAVAYSTDGTRVATTGDDRTASVCEAATGKVLKTIPLDGAGTYVLFSRDGKRLITDNSNCVLRSTELESGDGQTLTDKVVPRTLNLSADGKTIVVGGNGHGPLMIAVADGKMNDDVYDASDDVFSAAISADQKWIAGGTAGGSVCLWKISR